MMNQTFFRLDEIGLKCPKTKEDSYRKGVINMSKSKLVCNLSLADFFTLPDSDEVWRKKGGDPVWYVKDGKRRKGYDCESLYDASKKRWLPSNQRVDLVER